MVDWSLARCRDYDPDLWWDKGKAQRAQDICLSCPVARECLERAVKSGEPDGVWGALTPEGRRMWRARANVSNAK